MRTRFAQEGESEVVDALMLELSFCMQKIKKLEEEKKTLVRCNFILYNKKEDAQKTIQELKEELMLQETLVREHRDLLAKQQAASPPPCETKPKKKTIREYDIKKLATMNLEYITKIDAMEGDIEYNKALVASLTLDNNVMRQSLMHFRKKTEGLKVLPLDEIKSISAELKAISSAIQAELCYQPGASRPSQDVSDLPERFSKLLVENATLLGRQGELEEHVELLKTDNQKITDNAKLMEASMRGLVQQFDVNLSGSTPAMQAVIDAHMARAKPGAKPGAKAGAKRR